VLEVPCIRIAPPTKLEPLAEALAGLGSYEWVVFTSVNGVSAFFEHFLKAYEDLRALGMVRLAAVGPATAARLRELRLRVDVVPKDYVATRIVQALADTGSLENLRILLPRAEAANPDLPRLLEERGAIVDDIACYRTVAEEEDWNGAAARLEAEGADWITFASGSAVQHFHARFDLKGLRARRPGARVASIGPETSRVLSGLGVEPEVEARTHTIEGLAEALEQADRSTRAPVRRAGGAPPSAPEG
jgi:uroporphyrinogen III methyltransferase/synthase